MAQSTNLARALQQRLESLHRSGVQQLGRRKLNVQPIATQSTGVATVSSADVAHGQTEHVATDTAAPKPALAATQPDSADNSSVEDTSTVATTELAPQSKSVANDSISKPITSGATDSTLPPIDQLRILSQQVDSCELCPELAQRRTQTVFGVGNPQARLCFFGEAPGADEDRLGEPFVGKAGQLLTKIIEACTLNRDDVYIMNVLRCRPPGNRNPTLEEASNCRSFFEQQFSIVQPEYICCLGSVAAKTLLETELSIGKLRGRFHDWRGKKVVATYHPAYLLRNPSAKRQVWEDMKMLIQEMGIELPK